MKPALFSVLCEIKEKNVLSLRNLRDQVSPCYQQCADPDPNPDPHVFRPPGSGSGSISQRYGSGSGSSYH
jgi:hypothetical protein